MAKRKSGEADERGEEKRKKHNASSSSLLRWDDYTRTTGNHDPNGCHKLKTEQKQIIRAHYTKSSQGSTRNGNMIQEHELIAEKKSHLSATIRDFLKTETGDHELEKECRTLQSLLEKRASDQPCNHGRTFHSSENAKVASYTPAACMRPPAVLSPWSSAGIATTLPELPAVLDADLEVAAFTHSGVVSDPSSQSYERLEWVGDAYLYLISTLLISRTFVTHPPGKCAQIRELLVKNETLANYARQYDFVRRVRVPPEFSFHRSSEAPKKSIPKEYKAKDTGAVKVLGDVFEAYVAAVILSDPEQGVERVSQWLKSLWSRTVADRIHDEEARSAARKAKAPDLRKLNAKDTLVKEIGSKGVKISYRDAAPETKDPETGHPIFTVAVYLDGWGEKDLQLGIGSAKGKKDAGMNAAEMALADENRIRIYREKKKAFDDAMKLEQALA
ncbi:MAG: hypothetical protein M1818_003976 [Claussenomyces sp. TS43310]|nr:MAG: hypothetical protein M1818_003976 [Claussenomyces sp. TS43310]